MVEPGSLAQLEKLPVYLGGHLLITVVALAAGIAISLPLAVASLLLAAGEFDLALQAAGWL